MQRFVALHRLATDHVVTALRGDRISSRRLTFPFRERRKLAQAVPFEVEEELPFDLDDVVVDWEIVGGDRSPHGGGGGDRAAQRGVGAARRCAPAGCAPRTLEAEGLVLGNLAAIFELPGQRLLVDLGHRKTTLCVLVDGRAVAARTLPLGGRQLTEAIASDRGLSAADAERAKCEEGVLGAGLGDAPPQTAAVLDRLAREIVRTLGALEDLRSARGPRSTSSRSSAARRQLDRIDEILAERTGIPAARLGLPREGHGAGLVAGGPPILFAPAIALALRGTAQARTRMNFRQDEFAVRLDLGRFVRDFGSTAWTRGRRPAAGDR